MSRRSVRFLRAAEADLARLQTDDPQLPILALRTLRDLEQGLIDGEPLHAMAKTGDLGDCRKLYFGPGAPPTHRIVYRHLDDDPAVIEILEIVAIESRADLYAYLLAAQRLGRLPDDTRPELNRVHQRIIRTRTARRRQ